MIVLVTRPAEAAPPLLTALAVRGHAPLHEPLLRIAPVPDAAPDLTDVQALLLTSAAGVRALAAATAGRALPLLAVGEATAAAARAAGFTLVRAARGNAASLAELAIASADPAGGRLLHVSGEDVAGDLQGTLRRAGFRCERTVLYRAVAATALSPACRAVLDSGRLGAAMFHSPRMARTFTALLAASGRTAACREAAALALSPAVAAGLDAAGWREIAVAEATADAAMLALLDRLVQGERRETIDRNDGDAA